MREFFHETHESGKIRTHFCCRKCGKPITDAEAANVLGDGEKLVGFFHQSCDDGKLVDSENLRDWCFRLLWNSGLSDEDYAQWTKDQEEFGQQ